MKIFYRRPFFAAAFLTAAALIAAILFSCTEHPSITKQPSLIVHYYRYMGDYSGWNVWVWPANVSAEGGDNGSGEAKSFSFDTNKRDAEGFVTAHVIMPDTFKEFGMIIRKSENGNDWAEKDGNDDRFTAEKEVWLKQNDPAIYTAKPETAEPPILFAVADDPKMVSVTLLKEPADYSVFAVYEGGRRLAGTSQKAPVPEETSKDISGENSSATETASPDPAGKKPANARVLISLDEKITDVSKQYVVRDESGVFADQTVTMRNILDSFYYDGNDLGLSYRPDQSVFKVWAPTAADVSVALYDDSGTYNAAGKVTDNETDNLYKMKKDPATGVWSAAIAGNLDGKYYLYRVEGVSHPNWAADPYATAVSANGQRMAIINLESTNPPNWKPNSKPPFSNWQDAVLYELHVRDFSIDENSGMQHKGKFLAFTERGTKNGVSHSGAAKNGARHLFPTGIDHLVNLGITHVHLLPSFDFASINELTVDDPHSVDPKFNWGYDPQNYNVPEGSYSTDPANPRTRITEFKQMVQALHDAGIRVVMDVVYNHTYQTGAGPFDHLVPGYYYRTTDTGAYANGSACGNEVASERPMVRKYIIDSCLYWAKEYNIDGFRFDLMGLIDIPTMKELTEKVRSEADSSILIYGEPWQAGGSPLPAELQTLTGTQKNLNVAVFNDRIRTAIKGGSDDASKGFVTGASSREAGIIRGIQGSVHDFTGS
ncbi:MAG: type I pullulanase, partial [Treponema sp.]|nr:type I pullulanase [Treponema sp.]